MPLLGYVADDGSIVEQEPFLAEIVDVGDDGVLITEPVEEAHEFTVRDGDYPVIEAFFGDPHNPDHWESWQSPEFYVDTRRGGPPADPGPPANPGPPAGTGPGR